MVRARYQVEHQGIPSLLYTCAEGEFLDLLLEKQRNVMVLLYQIADPGTPCPYTVDDFAMEVHAMKEDRDDDRIIVVIDMPEPEDFTDCERVFLCFHLHSEKAGYYTVEKSLWSNMLCSWTREGAHENLGDAPETKEEQLERVLELFQ